MREKCTRISTFTICLGLACFFLTGTGLAGTTTVNPEIQLDCTQGVPDREITIPAASSVLRTMLVLRSGGGPGDFLLKVSLGGNAEFATGGLPVAGNLTQTGGVPAANVLITLIIGGADEDTFVDFLVDVTADFRTFPTFTLDTSGWIIRDVDNVLAGGGNITITLATRDTATGIPIDIGADTDVLISVSGPNCPPSCINIAESTEIAMAGALSSEERVVALLEGALSRAETGGEVRPRDADSMDADSMVADLAEALIAIANVNVALDLAEAFQCLAEGELLLIRPFILTASALDIYVSSRLGDPFSEVTLQTLFNLMRRAIEHKENAMETLISFGFFLIE